MQNESDVYSTLQSDDAPNLPGFTFGGDVPWDPSVVIDSGYECQLLEAQLANSWESLEKISGPDSSVRSKGGLEPFTHHRLVLRRSVVHCTLSARRTSLSR
jgi:hypothetical protein